MAAEQEAMPHHARPHAPIAIDRSDPLLDTIEKLTDDLSERKRRVQRRRHARRQQQQPALDFDYNKP